LRKKVSQALIDEEDMMPAQTIAGSRRRRRMPARSNVRAEVGSGHLLPQASVAALIGEPN
jgi:hypothetical protein